MFLLRVRHVISFFLNSTCDLARRAKAVSLRETGKKKNGNSHIVGFFWYPLRGGAESINGYKFFPPNGSASRGYVSVCYTNTDVLIKTTFKTTWILDLFPKWRTCSYFVEPRTA